MQHAAGARHKAHGDSHGEEAAAKGARARMTRWQAGLRPLWLLVCCVALCAAGLWWGPHSCYGVAACLIGPTDVPSSGKANHQLQDNSGKARFAFASKAPDMLYRMRKLMH